jgi:hypothetical protein
MNDILQNDIQCYELYNADTANQNNNNNNNNNNNYSPIQALLSYSHSCNIRYDPLLNHYCPDPYGIIQQREDILYNSMIQEVKMSSPSYSKDEQKRRIVKASSSLFIIAGSLFVISTLMFLVQAFYIQHTKRSRRLRRKGKRDKNYEANEQSLLKNLDDDNDGVSTVATASNESIHNLWTRTRKLFQFKKDDSSKEVIELKSIDENIETETIAMNDENASMVATSCNDYIHNLWNTTCAMFQFKKGDESNQPVTSADKDDVSIGNYSWFGDAIVGSTTKSNIDTASVKESSVDGTSTRNVIESTADPLKPKELHADALVDKLLTRFISGTKQSDPSNVQKPKKRRGLFSQFWRNNNKHQTFVADSNYTPPEVGSVKEINKLENVDTSETTRVKDILPIEHDVVDLDVLPNSNPETSIVTDDSLLHSSITNGISKNEISDMTTLPLNVMEEGSKNVYDDDDVEQAKMKDDSILIDDKEEPFSLVSSVNDSMCAVSLCQPYDNDVGTSEVAETEDDNNIPVESTLVLPHGQISYRDTATGSRKMIDESQVSTNEIAEDDDDGDGTPNSNDDIAIPVTHNSDDQVSLETFRQSYITKRHKRLGLLPQPNRKKPVGFRRSFLKLRPGSTTNEGDDIEAARGTTSEF